MQVHALDLVVAANGAERSGQIRSSGLAYLEGADFGTGL